MKNEANNAQGSAELLNVSPDAGTLAKRKSKCNDTDVITNVLHELQTKPACEPAILARVTGRRERHPRGRGTARDSQIVLHNKVQDG